MGLIPLAKLAELRKEKADHDAQTGRCACRNCALTPYLDTIETLYRENAELEKTKRILVLQRAKLQAVANAAEAIRGNMMWKISTARDERNIEEFIEALAALKEDSL